MIQTERLILQPLTYGHLLKYIAADGSLEKELQLNATSRTLSVELKEALEQAILPNVTDTSKNYLYNTLWTAISKLDQKMIGDLCIIGDPNAAGEIEIGYGTYDEFQGNGFMTEIVGGIIGWARTQPFVKSIKASTEKSNTASFKVLQKNGFLQIGGDETFCHWKVDI